jgi:hypothetical protein
MSKDYLTTYRTNTFNPLDIPTHWNNIGFFSKEHTKLSKNNNKWTTPNKDSTIFEWGKSRKDCLVMVTCKTMSDILDQIRNRIHTTELSDDNTKITLANLYNYLGIMRHIKDFKKMAKINFKDSITPFENTLNRCTNENYIMLKNIFGKVYLQGHQKQGKISKYISKNPCTGDQCDKDTCQKSCICMPNIIADKYLVNIKKKGLFKQETIFVKKESNGTKTEEREIDNLRKKLNENVIENKDIVDDKLFVVQILSFNIKNKTFQVYPLAFGINYKETNVYLNNLCFANIKNIDIYINKINKGETEIEDIYPKACISTNFPLHETKKKKSGIDFIDNIDLTNIKAEYETILQKIKTENGTSHSQLEAKHKELEAKHKELEATQKEKKELEKELKAKQKELEEEKKKSDSAEATVATT